MPDTSQIGGKSMILWQIAHRTARLGEADVFAKNAGRPGGGMHAGQEHFDESGLARAVRAEQSVLSADGNAQRQVGDGLDSLPRKRPR